jgi:hypothetical protein
MLWLSKIIWADAELLLLLRRKFFLSLQDFCVPTLDSNYLTLLPLQSGWTYGHEVDLRLVGLAFWHCTGFNHKQVYFFPFRIKQTRPTKQAIRQGTCSPCAKFSQIIKATSMGYLISYESRKFFKRKDWSNAIRCQDKFALLHVFIMKETIEYKICQRNS